MTIRIAGIFAPLRLLAMAVVLAASAGCESLTYQEPQPTKAPTARVRFIAFTSDVALLRSYDDKDCTQNEREWMRLRSGFLLNSHPKSLGMPLWGYDPNAAKEVYVDTRLSLSWMFSATKLEPQVGALASYSCGTMFSYPFQPNHDYEVAFATTGHNCDVTIQELISEGDSWRREVVAKFDNSVNDKNRDCIAQFKKMWL